LFFGIDKFKVFIWLKYFQGALKSLFGAQKQFKLFSAEFNFELEKF